jgi:ElaB/YqjD/DUF883 family membrane-anchored ribosome-binding protein
MTENVKSIDRAKEVVSGGVEKTKATLETAKGKIQDASEVVKKEAGRAGEVAKEKYDVAATNLRDGYGKARKDLDKLGEDVNVYVRDNPGRSVLMAAAAGFFLGFLIRGERRR